MQESNTENAAERREANDNGSVKYLEDWRGREAGRGGQVIAGQAGK